MERKIAEELLKIGAVFLRPNQPFTWASGIKSPIYCDNRLTLSYPKTRAMIESSLVSKIRSLYPNCEYIMGTATAGIAHAAIVANLMNLPMGYVRSLNKTHGRENTIEGKLIPGANVVVIEDLISTGGSCINVVVALREAGFHVLGVVSIFTYRLKVADEIFSQNNVSYHSISNYDALIEVALELGYINQEDVNKLSLWKQNPSDESWISDIKSQI